MCGITGIVSPSQRQVIVPMTDAIAHRGPDACGYYRDEHVALGNRRLSIIDLTTGDQPIANEAGNLQLVCNGEIYNSPELRRQLAPRHQFRTRTDIEVILHLFEDYGTECVKHLRGMFAFAIWNRDDRTLFLARDHMGQKPLFYCEIGEHFLFASEIKAILASGLAAPEIDLEGLWHYVSMRFMPDRYSLFKGIQKLPAGTSLCWQRGAIKLERYWDLRFTQKSRRSEHEIVDELDALLFDTVRMHLLSDVRVGAFLSGGINSSLISAMTAKASSEVIPAFSIGVKDEGFDELPYARQVVARYGMEAHERVVQADLIRLIPSMIHHMDEPADPFGAGVYLVSGVAREVVKVALTGDGGDESFAGYDRFAGQRLLDYYCLLPEWFRRTIVQKLVERSPELVRVQERRAKGPLAQRALSLWSGGALCTQHEFSAVHSGHQAEIVHAGGEEEDRGLRLDAKDTYVLPIFECRRSGRPDALYGPDDPNAGPSACHGRSHEHGTLSRSAVAPGGLQGRRVRRHDSRTNQIETRSAQIYPEESRRTLPAAEADRAQEAGFRISARALDAHRSAPVHDRAVR